MSKSKSNSKTTKNNRMDIVDIVFVIDKSGSMGSLTNDTIGGFNSFVEEQKQVDGNAYITVILFDTLCKVLYDRVNIKEVEPLTTKQYRTSGCTALIDAVGLGIDKEISILKDLDDEKLPAKVLFNIITDGEENSSCEYSLSQIKSKIKELEKIGKWEFSFLGANIDSFKSAESLGISSSNACNFTHSSSGMSSVYGSLANSVTAFRTACSNQQAMLDNGMMPYSSAEIPTYFRNFDDIK